MPTLPSPGSCVVVLSTHLDDAVLSLGGMLHAYSERGVEVRVVTVLSNDPAATRDAAPWDAACGFPSAGAAARARRLEDGEACRVIGARPTWLPYGDEMYGRGASDDEIWGAILPSVADADAIFAPGFPLLMPDHAWLYGLVMTRRPTLSCPVFLYGEQPYAAGAHVQAFRSSPWRALADRHVRTNGQAMPHGVDAPSAPPTPTWRRIRTSLRDRVAKTRAIARYRSQLRPLGRLVLAASQLEEILWRGELVGRVADDSGQTWARD